MQQISNQRIILKFNIHFGSEIKGILVSLQPKSCLIISVQLDNKEWGLGFGGFGLIVNSH